MRDLTHPLLRTRLPVLLAGVLAVVVAIGGSEGDPPLWLLALPLAVLAAWTATARVPSGLLVATSAGVAVWLNTGRAEAEGAFFVACAAVLGLVVHGRPRPAVHLAAATTAATPLVAWATQEPGAPDWGWPYWVAGIALTWLMGEVLHRQLELTAALRRGQARLADQAATDERQRIARELHDLLGHSLTVVLLHLTGARRLVHRDPDEAEAGLLQAEAVGRRALDDIRSVVRLLRTGPEGEAAPTPDGSDVASLVAEARAAGLDLIEERQGDLSAIDGADGLAAYRIVQESLANAARHGSAGPVHLRTEVGDGHVRIVVTNPVAPGRAAGEPGSGLIGMRERALALGGELRAGARGGVWEVAATMPRPVGRVEPDGARVPPP